MHDNFSPKVKDVIAFSKEEALRLGHDFIGTEHLMLGIIRQGEGRALTLLKSLQIDLALMRKKIEEISPAKDSLNQNPNRTIHLTKQADKALKTTFLEAKLYKDASINTAHLLLCILRNENDPTTKLLHQFNATYSVVRNEYKEQFSNPIEETTRAEYPSDEGNQEQDNPFNPARGPQNPQSQRKTKTPVLDNFGRDLTQLAIEGKLDPVVGRKAEIERVSQILSRRKKNNPVLIGEPGVGKSAIAEGLALRIVQRKVSR
ncbi:MAG: ATP-dependent Clp protease ATP-binding subunit, partial [Flavobacteriaceae bacterium]|nr:ATP-dependent Clp protease ATP-binding subunit [Flavobacteriaceae bacterium]